MDLILKTYTLELQHKFTISRGSYNEQPTLIVELKEGNLSGYGEAPSNTYYNITVDAIKRDLISVKPILERCNDIAPELFWEKMQKLLPNNSFALCALDMAYNDLYAKKQQQKLYEYWGLSTRNNPKTNYTIAIDSIENMVLKLKEKPWPIYKIKLGTSNDVAIIKALRQHTNAKFRIDANCGWTRQETVENSKIFKDLGVEFIEQPLKADDWEGYKYVFKHSELPIIADESCLLEDDVLKCHNHFHGINVKLVKCGGLTPAKRMLEKARSLGMKTMVGCMVESSIGISAIAHLLPLLDYVDMDGSLLLKNDIAKGVSITEGIISYSDLNGIGATLL